MQIYQRNVAIEILAADGDVSVIFFNVPIYSTNNSLIGTGSSLDLHVFNKSL